MRGLIRGCRVPPIIFFSAVHDIPLSLQATSTTRKSETVDAADVVGTAADTETSTFARDRQVTARGVNSEREER